MKKTILLTTSVLLAAGLQSCSGTREMDNSRLCHISAQTALFGAPQTKTQVGELVGDELLINWTPGDQIGIVTSNSTVSCFTNQTAEESANGDFTGLLSGTPTCAFYPYVEGVTDLTAVPFYIPTDQVYTGPESIGLCDVRVATTVNDTPEGYRMHFNSLTCLLRFEVDLTGLEAYTEKDEDTGELFGEKSTISFYPGECVTMVNMDIDGPGLTCGEEEVTFYADITSDSPELRNDGGDGIINNAVNVLLYDYEGGIPVTGSNTAIFYAVVAPGAVAGATIDFELETMVDCRYYAHAIHFTASLHSDMIAGHYYTVPVKASSLNALSDVHCYDYELLDSEEEEEEEEDGEGGDNIED